MAEPLVPDVAVNICHNSIPHAGSLSRQYEQAGCLVSVREIPCSGKIDIQYLLHALESVRLGVIVVACPSGSCRLGQGNERAEVRVATVQRLLAEIGLEPGRIELVHGSADEPMERLEQLLREAIERLSALGPSPLSSPTAPFPANPSAQTRGGASGRASPVPT